jgi:ADP-heptose:LPS heptosyltransferase
VRILVLRGGALGDLILTLPALQALRKQFPEAHIRLAGSFPHAALVAPWPVDEVEDVNASFLTPLFGHGENLDLLLSLFSSIDLVINYLSDPDRRVEGHLLRLGIGRHISGPSRPIETEGAGHASCQLFAPLLKLGLEWTEPLLHPRSVVREMGKIAFHIGSGSSSKNWPLDRWSQLIAGIEPEATTIHVVAGEADRSRLDALKRSKYSSKVHFVENRPLDQLADLLAGCGQFAGHDSGVSHLAAALGTPTVALFGPTDPGIWAPRGRSVTVIQSLDRRLESISVDEVLAALGKSTSVSAP